MRISDKIVAGDLSFTFKTKREIQAFELGRVIAVNRIKDDLEGSESEYTEEALESRRKEKLPLPKLDMQSRNLLSTGKRTRRG